MSRQLNNILFFVDWNSVPKYVFSREFSRVVCKDWGLENNTNLNSIFFLIKRSEIVLIFLLAFYLIINYMAHDIPKEF